MEHNRKPNRLQYFDYSETAVYFITICTQDRRKVSSEIVGTGVLDCPTVHLLPHGMITDKYLRQMDAFYDHLSVEQYVIMPDHIHLLIAVHEGQSRMPVPTKANSTIAKFVSTFKRFCNKEFGANIWQGRYYDHVIRNQQDYNEIWEYIQNNPRKWMLTRTKTY